MPSIFRGARAMWTGIATSRLIDEKVQALVNRSVASLNGCEFRQDINAAVGNRLGISDEKILALVDYTASPLYSEVERVTLEYAETMTITGREVSNAQVGVPFHASGEKASITLPLKRKRSR